MKRTIQTVLYFITTIALLAMFGCDLGPQDGSKATGFNIPPKPDNGWYIRDTAGKLSPADINTLNHRIETFNRTTRNEIGVLVIPSLNSYDLDDVAHDVFHSWGIGKAGLDNGILILIASNDHKMRIETGNGAEGDVPDAIAGQLIDGMKPYLRRNDYAGAITSAVDGIQKNMESRVGQKPIVPSTGLVGQKDTQTQAPLQTQTPSEPDDATAIELIFGFLGVLGISALFAMWIVSRREKSQRSWVNSGNSNSFHNTKKPTASFKTNPTTNYSDPYYPPPPPRTHVPHVPIAPIVVAGAAVAAVGALSASERREKQRKEDEARKHRDHKRNEAAAPKREESTYVAPTYTYEPPSGGGIGGGGFDGGGFGGGDSGGGGASGGW